MMLCIGVEQPPDHALVLRVMFAGLAFEELDASLAQRDGDLHAFIPKDEVLRSRKDVRNDLEISERFVGVFDFLAHIPMGRGRAPVGHMITVRGKFFRSVPLRNSNSSDFVRSSPWWKMSKTSSVR